MSKHAIPICLAAFDFIEAGVCALARDWARAWYWAAAGQITLATIYMTN